jgi:aldehyde dehydrogenase (NAD+)
MIVPRKECNLVAGAWIPAQGGGWIAVLDPSSGEEIAQVPEMGAGDLDQALDAARDGFRKWRDTAGPDRASVLLRAAMLLRDRIDVISADLVAEMGKTLAEARGEVERSADFFDFFSAFGRMAAGEVLPDRRAGLTFTQREPLGVVLAITPWNDPLLTPARKLAPTLIAGNAVILKAASETPLVALHLARALHDAGLPVGAIATVTGRGSRVGPSLLADKRVDAVTFTGSTDTGGEIRRALAGRNVRLQNEMGGKNAAVILADGDIEMAVKTVIGAAFGQAGQRCTATSRLLVDARVYPAVVDRLKSACEAIVLGPGTDKRTQMGPLVSRQQQATVLHAIETARREGAKVACGGSAPGGALSRGCYFEPTVVIEVEAPMAVWREEIFGPVLAVRPVESLEEAIAEVNDSCYGLSSAIFTRDLRAAHEFARSVDTGQVAVNLSTSGWDVHIPFGGFRDSGSPFKEQGAEAMRFYTKLKTISIAH